eukprot:scaffold6581_cov57-Attheya_sp.AAC.21
MDTLLIVLKLAMWFPVSSNISMKPDHWAHHPSGAPHDTPVHCAGGSRKITLYKTTIDVHTIFVY